MIRIIKKSIKKTFNLIGIDIVRLPKNPAYTLLGLKYLAVKTIIDVGANTGQFARIASKIFPEANIYCFEPLLEPFKKLHKWAKSKKGKVIPFNLALGDDERNLEMFSHIGHSPSSSFLRTTKTCEYLYPFTKNSTSVQVKVTTMDAWRENLGCETSLNLEIMIKLDVQGYENRVIRGGVHVFNDAKACILEVCLDSLYEDQATFNDISLLLYELGYHYVGNLNQTYADDGHVIYIDALFVK